MNLKKTFCSLFTLTVFSFSSLSAALYNHSGPKYDLEPRNALDKAGSQIGAPYKLKLISSGLGTLAGATEMDHIPWALLFTSPEKMNLEQAKAMAKDIATKLLEKMYEDPCFANYSKESLKTAPKGPYFPLSDKDLSFRIDFWDENVDRPLYPYVAEIRLIKETLYYYYANPKTQGLEEPAAVIEPFSRTKK